MSFFPIFRTHKFEGFCTVHNFRPNNWEKIKNLEKTVWAIFSNGEVWITKELDKLRIGESKTYYYSEIISSDNLKKFPIILLQLRKSPLKEYLDTLPEHEFKYNRIPEWRSTVGFNLLNTNFSYQGEINPFPEKGSLLTFHPFIQQNRTSNYFVFLNVEKSPIVRKSEIEIYDAQSKEFIEKVNVYSNHVNLFGLDKYRFSSSDLPVFVSRSMAGIPFGMGVSVDLKMISFEHTHPPASFVVHGHRFKVQSIIKKKWFNSLNQ